MQQVKQLSDPAIESALLGSILINPAAIVDVIDKLTPEDFQGEARGWVFGVLRDLYQSGAKVDYVTVADLLHRRGQLEEMGGSAALTELINRTPNSLHTQRYAEVVSRFSTLRSLMSAAGKIAQLAHSSEDAAINDVFAKARGLVDAVAPMASDDTVLLWPDSLTRFSEGQVERIEEQRRIDEGAELPRCTFPWKALQRYISYARPGMLITIAADSSVGKTTFMECVAEHWARLGLQVAFFHLELSHRVMLDRRMIRQSGEALWIVESGQHTGAMAAATDAMDAWAGGINYVHCPGWTTPKIAAKAHQMHTRGLCDAMIVDYLQKARLIRNKGQNDASAIGDQVESLKTPCEQLGIAGILGSQFSRAQRQYNRKTAGGIRGSGEVEEKSNIVITLDRPILDNDMQDEYGNIIAKEGDRSPETRGRVDKNTLGATGDFSLFMTAPRFVLTDVAMVSEQPVDELVF